MGEDNEKDPGVMWFGGSVDAERLRGLRTDVVMVDDDEDFDGDEMMTLEETREHARSLGVPGPDVLKHPAGEDGNPWSGECYCRECLEDM